MSPLGQMGKKKPCALRLLILILLIETIVSLILLCTSIVFVKVVLQHLVCVIIRSNKVNHSLQIHPQELQNGVFYFTNVSAWINNLKAWFRVFPPTMLLQIQYELQLRAIAGSSSLSNLIYVRQKRMHRMIIIKTYKVLY